MVMLRGKDGPVWKLQGSIEAVHEWEGPGIVPKANPISPRKLLKVCAQRITPT